MVFKCTQIAKMKLKTSYHFIYGQLKTMLYKYFMTLCIIFSYFVSQKLPFLQNMIRYSYN